MDEECLRIVKSFWQERKCKVGNDLALTVPAEEVPANYVPAAAVIRRGRTLFGITGRKEYVGC